MQTETHTADVWIDSTANEEAQVSHISLCCCIAHSSRSKLQNHDPVATEKLFCDLKVPRLHRILQRCRTPSIFCIHICTLSYQVLHRLVLPFGCRQVQWSARIIVTDVGVHAMIEDELEGVEVARARCVAEPASDIVSIELRIPLHEQLYHRALVVYYGVLQRRVPPPVCP